MKKLAVVVPSIRPEAMIAWWERWKTSFMRDGLKVIVVWDMENIPDECEFSSQVIELCWADIKPEWKDVVHCKSDSVRNLGFLKAAELGYEYIATLDDDVFPVDNLWVDRMLLNLQREVDPVTFYPAPFKTRGHPSKPLLRPVKLHHGLWEGVPDVYARDQQGYTPLDGMAKEVRTVPYGNLAPVCGMNIAFQRDLLPAMYFWPQVPYRRYGDIWMGLIAKKVIDACGWAMTSGSPSIFHTRLSDRDSNLKYEEAGKEINDRLWDAISYIDLGIGGYCSVVEVVNEILSRLDRSIIESTGCKLREWTKITRGILGGTCA